jgi:hypothetical protein
VPVEKIVETHVPVPHPVEVIKHVPFVKEVINEVFRDVPAPYEVPIHKKIVQNVAQPYAVPVAKAIPVPITPVLEKNVITPPVVEQIPYGHRLGHYAKS